MRPPSPRPSQRLALPAVALGVSLACGELPDRSFPMPQWDAETEARARFEATPIAVTGQVLDATGRPLEGALVELDGRQATSGADGSWSLQDVPRRNALLRVTAPGRRTHVAGAHLVRPMDVARADLGATRLDPDVADEARLLFAGDMALGRRYLDPDEATPRDRVPEERPDALIRRSQASADSVDLVDDVLPIFEAADLRVVNLESPVTDDPSTPHWDKQWAFFTLPDSLAALQHLGVELVSLGNNHVYDYLERGIVDTLSHLDAWGIAHAGAGLDPDSAYVPHRRDVRGAPYSFVSATSISGVGRTEPLFVAEEGKGGAADLRDDARLIRTLDGERDAGRLPIALMHAGNEYAREPNDYFFDRVRLAAEHGAVLAIGHHPHRTQGFSRIEGVLFVHSLGNFAFDQDRLETLPGYLFYTDLRSDEVVRAGFVPQTVDDYRARPSVGELADWTVRDAGETSDRAQVHVIWDGGHGRLVEDTSTLQFATRQVTATVTFGVDGMGHLDLRPLREAGESVLRVEAGAATSVWLGTDLMHFGTFEDEDVDGDLLEASRWFWGETARPCVTGAWRGAAGMCVHRTERHAEDAVVAFRNRVRVLGDATNEPIKDATLFARMRADNAGPIRLYVRHQASFGDKVFGDDTALAHPGGTFDWREVIAPLTFQPEIPGTPDPASDNDRSVRPFLSVGPPREGAGMVALDDVAVANWYEGPLPGPTHDLQTPNTTDFLRMAGAPGSAQVTLTFVRPTLASTTP